MHVCHVTVVVINVTAEVCHVTVVGITSRPKQTKNKVSAVLKIEKNCRKCDL